MFPSKSQFFSLAALGAAAYLAISYTRDTSTADEDLIDTASEALDLLNLDYAKIKKDITIRKIVPQTEKEIVPQTEKEIVPQTEKEIAPQTEKKIVPQTEKEIAPQTETIATPQKKLNFRKWLENSIPPDSRIELEKMKKLKMEYNLYLEGKSNEQQNNTEDLSPITIPKSNLPVVGEIYHNVLHSYMERYMERKGTAWIDTLLSSLGIEKMISVSELVGLMIEVRTNPANYPLVTHQAVANVFDRMGTINLKALLIRDFANQDKNIRYPYLPPLTLPQELIPIFEKLNSDEGLSKWINNASRSKEEAILIHCFELSAEANLVKQAKAIAKEIVKTIPCRP